jgi:hypothetical protein
MLDGISECEVQLEWSGVTASSLGKRYHGVILEKVGFYAKKSAMVSLRKIT